MAGGPTASGLDYLAYLMTTGETAVNFYYVALVPDLEPGFSSTGESITEPQFADYERAAIYNESAAWTVNNQVLSNTYEITFTEAVNDWGYIRYWAICDDPTEGRVFFVGEFPEPIYVSAGGSVVLDAGTLTLQFEGVQWKLGV